MRSTHTTYHSLVDTFIIFGDEHTTHYEALQYSLIEKTNDKKIHPRKNDWLCVCVCVVCVWCVCVCVCGVCVMCVYVCVVCV